MNWFDRCVAELYVGEHPELNVWPARPESGIDRSQMPRLAGSGLEKFFQPHRPATPVPQPDPEEEIDNPFVAIFVILAAVVYFIVWPLRIFVAFRGEVLLERAIAEEPQIPKLSWEEFNTFLRESTWEHDDNA